MRWLFIASGMKVPSTRFRVLPYLPFLRKAGHQCDLAFSWPEKYDYHPLLGWRISQFVKRERRKWQAWNASRIHYDAILLEREIFHDPSYDIEMRFRKVTPRMVLDVDDGIFLNFPEKYEVLAKSSDAVLCGNNFLLDYTRPLNANVQLLPTCVELGHYPVRDKARDGSGNQVTIGWIGTTQNVAFLEVCAEALRNLSRRHSFRLLVVAPQPDRLREIDLSGVEIDFRKWSPETEIGLLHQMDLGIMPLPADQEWMKYKCGLKLIQYLAVGIPGVASPIGVNEAILSGNQVGLAAQSSEQWEVALETLLTDSARRLEMGKLGRCLVEKQYSIEGNWQLLERTLQSQG